VNVGCLAASDAYPIKFITDLKKGLSIKRFTEYGANYAAFTKLAEEVGTIVEADLSLIIREQFKKPVSVLGINTIGDALSSSEAVFQKAHYIGPVRSRKMMNVATAAVLEYLSG
jgi:hypothetical protein